MTRAPGKTSSRELRVLWRFHIGMAKHRNPKQNDSETAPPRWAPAPPAANLNCNGRNWEISPWFAYIARLTLLRWSPVGVK